MEVNIFSLNMVGFSLGFHRTLCFIRKVHSTSIRLPAVRDLCAALYLVYNLEFGKEMANPQYLRWIRHFFCMWYQALFGRQE